MQTLKKVKTNNVPRFLSYFGELPKAVQVEYEVFFAPACVKLPKNSKRTYIK